MRDLRSKAQDPHGSSGRRSNGRSASPETRRTVVGAGTVAAQTISRFLEVGVAAGVRRDVLMAAAGCTDDDLRDPNARVPMAVEVALWKAIAKLTSDPEFGVEAGRRYRVRDLGLVGHVARFSARLEDALHGIQRYVRVLSETVEFELNGRRARVATAKVHPGLGPAQAMAEAIRLAVLLQLSRELTGLTIVPAEVTFTYPEPSRAAAHREFFRSTLRFSAPEATIVFRAADLDCPVVEADEAVASYLRDYAEQMLVSLSQGESMRLRVRSALWSVLGDGPPSLTRVAALLRVPPRTLQRRLAAEGTSLHQEIEDVRRTMAVALLRDRSVAIEEVASFLGYSEPTSFFRSFRRWMGTTPRHFRDVAITQQAQPPFRAVARIARA